MMSEYNLIDFLYKENDHEIKQKEKNMYINDYDFNYFFSSNSDIPRFKKEFFLKDSKVFISKHNRYANYPLHTHQFFEINYVYSGISEQIINGNKHILEQGDILLLNPNSYHEIKKMDYDDILINIVFEGQNINLDFLRNIKQSNSILYTFLLNNIESNNSLSDYIILKKNKNYRLITIIKQMLEEYFLKDSFSNEIIENYLSILLYNLARNLPIDSKDIKYKNLNSIIIDILNIIDRDYKNITLNNLSKKLNYNKNYLSNMIKKNTGKTLTELVNQRRILEARNLLSSTNFSITSICYKVGYTNKNYFYKKYKQYYNETPNETRLNK